MGADTKSAVSMDSLHGDTPVAQITITLLRSGMMKIEGSITDEKFVEYMFETASQTMKGYHAKQKLGQRSPIVVPPWDTALTGTAEEKKLLAARDELANAMAGSKAGG